MLRVLVIFMKIFTDALSSSSKLVALVVILFEIFTVTVELVALIVPEIFFVLAVACILRPACVVLVSVLIPARFAFFFYSNNGFIKKNILQDIECKYEL